jgi:RNA polymerase sigma-70 factor (ECF subfamily)
MAPDPLPQAEWDYLASKEGRTQRLPDRFASIVADYDNQFKMVRLAAHSAVPCDWGTDESAGPGMLLPQLARAKAVVVAARLRVMWELQHGRQADARDDLLASLRLARNVPRDGTLISVLVQIAMEAISCNIVAENFGQFTPETLKELADGLEALPARGTVASSITSEERHCSDWVLNKVQELRKEYPGDDTKVMAGVRELFAGMESTDEGQTNQAQFSLWEQVSKAAGGTSDGLINLLHQRKQLYQRFAQVAALPYAEYGSQAKQLTAAVQVELEQTPNPLLSLLLPAWERSREKEFKALVFLGMVRAAVEYKLHGEPGLQSVPDPCGQGPFAFQRLVLQGVDRGFELKSANTTGSFQQVLIFVEKEGPPFFVDGPYAGQACPWAENVHPESNAHGNHRLRDAGFLAQAQAGDAEAFGEVCRVYETRLLRQAMALCGSAALAEDLAQDTLVEAWKCLRRYNGQCQFFTWLCAILLNRYRNTVRQKRPMPFSSFQARDQEGLQDCIGRLADQEYLPDEVAQRREQAVLVQQCIQALPAKHQQVIHLRFYVDDSLEGIAAALGCSVGTVKSRLFHALDKLRGMNALSEHLGNLNTKVGVL